MADNLSPENRRKNMVAIKSKDTKPEVFFRKALFHNGYRYRVHTNLVPGHPDIWLKKYNTAIFVHGCFWHRHQGCRFTTTPGTRIEYWEKKFRNNIDRDKRVKEELERLQIKCLVLWECTIKTMKKDPEIAERILNDVKTFLESSDLYCEM